MKKRKQGTGAKRSAARTSRIPKAARASTSRAPSGVFALAADCTIAHIAPLRAGLAKLLKRPSAVTLDVNAVQRIDTASMQLVAAFVRERESHGRQVEWRGAAPVFGSAARLLGLAPTLHLPDSQDKPA
jgi:ABC-type transporter Mla MlaB component